MIERDDKQAFLILTNRISKKIIRHYKKLQSATRDLGDVFILFHSSENNSTVTFENIKIETFSNDVLHRLSYKPIKKSLVPGSNHFPILDFYLKHPDYAYYWCMEDDVAFSGKWSDFFREVSSNLNYDFITSHIRRYEDLPRWFWWNTYNTASGEVNKEELLNSFNPIYRISNPALKYVDSCLKIGYSGHHEVLLPTLLRKAGFKISDFGEAANHVSDQLSYCTLGTMRWKPVFFIVGNKKNKLYHPVKERITFKQLLVYLKRTIYGQKEYFK